MRSAGLLFGIAFAVFTLLALAIATVWLPAGRAQADGIPGAILAPAEVGTGWRTVSYVLIPDAGSGFDHPEGLLRSPQYPVPGGRGLASVAAYADVYRNESDALARFTALRDQLAGAQRLPAVPLNGDAYGHRRDYDLDGERWTEMTLGARREGVVVTVVVIGQRNR